MPIYRNALGQFISKATHDAIERKSLISGRFVSATQARRERSREAKLTQRFKGPPVGGKNWVSIAHQYPERFAAFL